MDRAEYEKILGFYEKYFNGQNDYISKIEALDFKVIDNLANDEGIIPAAIFCSVHNDTSVRSFAAFLLAKLNDNAAIINHTRSLIKLSVPEISQLSLALLERMKRDAGADPVSELVAISSDLNCSYEVRKQAINSIKQVVSNTLSSSFYSWKDEDLENVQEAVSIFLNLVETQEPISLKSSAIANIGDLGNYISPNQKQQVILELEGIAKVNEGLRPVVSETLGKVECTFLLNDSNDLCCDVCCNSQVSPCPQTSPNTFINPGKVWDGVVCYFSGKCD
ncbi:hypothetical protein IQ260_29285 [Leptolyngbya cf. ectocarpi LEGE 11479]|uniref:Uncharacterized protein n=1 Tax=Leptolyngbya cf. ectocarpi LEGE 11479 TaxID=1828722 RepID=A0A929A0D0_LEPEC|nr:hypothetical protein [Leptolyngbya ectocarpi]MBE9070737.1 hypothetical protein [Leptolyngbya cf. ectocarpi LEGE 11479]